MVLDALDESVSWARMKIKPQKSRSLIIRKGKVTKKFVLKIQDEEITYIEDKPVKCLGKWFDSSLKDQGNIKQLEGKVTEGLKNIDKTELPRKFKAWMYQHGLLPRLLWPLTLYEVSSTTVVAL